MRLSWQVYASALVWRCYVSVNGQQAYRQNWSISPHDSSMQPFYPFQRAYQLPHIRKNTYHSKKKEQEGQHDYPLSNHLRCDTMWSPSPSRSPLPLPPPAPPSRSHWNPSYAYDACYLPLHKLQEEQLQASGTKINSGFICGTIITNYWLIIHKKIMFLLSSIPRIVPLKVWTVFLIIFYRVTNLHIFHSPL